MKRGRLRVCVCWMHKERVQQAKESLYFFFNDTATTEIYTLSLHDALPILPIDNVSVVLTHLVETVRLNLSQLLSYKDMRALLRSEEHTSELQSRPHISYAGFCLKKKKFKMIP